jgi:hypothetical protein
MSEAFENVRTLPASKGAKTKMKQLVSLGLFSEQRDVWRLGAALGIALGQVKKGGTRETFQNVNSLDTDGIFAAVMVGLYPDMKPDERAKKLVDYAEWGIDEIARRQKIGTLDLSELAGLNRE